MLKFKQKKNMQEYRNAQKLPKAVAESLGAYQDRKQSREPRLDLKKILLATVAVAGVLTVAALAPNAMQVIELFGVQPKKRQKEFIAVARDRMVAHGLLRYEKGKVRLTPKGEREWRRISATGYKLKKPAKWDGKWRMLIFDIPHHRRITRDRLRQTLAMLGFVHLQHSVWLYPYDCEETILLLKADFRIGQDLLYIVAEKLENDRMYRERFGLA